jgi:hypothetical protein
LFAAGVNPGPDGQFGTADDDGNGGAMTSITMRAGTDATTHFYANAFPRFVKMPKKTDPGTDPRFTIVS